MFCTLGNLGLGFGRFVNGNGQFRPCACRPRIFVRAYSSRAEPQSVADLKTEGRWFDPRLGQHSFRGLMIVIATGFIRLSPLSIVSTMVMWESSQ